MATTINYDIGCRSLEPPCHYNTPYAIKCMSEGGMEPSINVKNSWHYLQEYEVTNEAMRKAKEYWLNNKPTLEKPCSPEKLPSEVSNDEEFLRAAEFLRVQVWKWHVLVESEDSLNIHYHRSASDRSPEENTPAHLFSNDINVNRANRNIWDPLEIPETFQTLNDYLIYEPKDHSYVLACLRVFPEISEGIALAKKYWSENITKEEAKVIIENYPNEIQRFRELLWKRHISLEGERERDLKFCDELAQEAAWNEKKNLFLGTIATVAGLVFLVYQYSDLNTPKTIKF